MGVSDKIARTYAEDPKVQQALQVRRTEIEKEFSISRSDVLKGIVSAIGDAKLLGDPTAQIGGWREIGRMLGYYEPERHVVQLSDKREEALKQLEDMDMATLMEMSGEDVLEAEFQVLN
jgi:phage terminase small subunit